MRPVLLTLFLLLLFRPAAAQTYTIREVSHKENLGVLFPRHLPKGIVDIGSATVFYDGDTEHPFSHSFLEINGRPANQPDITVEPGFHWYSEQSIPRHTNQAGELDGHIIDLGTLPGGKNCWLGEWNSKGEIAGTADMADGTKHAVLFTGGELKDIGTLPGYEESCGQYVNEKGQMIGYCDKLSEKNSRKRIDEAQKKGTVPLGAPWPRHGFLYFAGKMMDLGLLPGGFSVYPIAINNAGQIVGSASTNVPDGPTVGSSCEDHAFLYRDGKMLDLNSIISEKSTWALCEAFRINDKGQISGSGQHNGVDVGFLLTPKP